MDIKDLDLPVKLYNLMWDLAFKFVYCPFDILWKEVFFLHVILS